MATEAQRKQWRTAKAALRAAHREAAELAERAPLPPPPYLTPAGEFLPAGLAYVEGLAVRRKQADYIASALGLTAAAFRAALSVEKGDNPVNLAFERGRAYAKDALLEILNEHAKTSFIPAIYLSKSLYGLKEGDGANVEVTNKIAFTFPRPAANWEEYQKIPEDDRAVVEMHEGRMILCDHSQGGIMVFEDTREPVYQDGKTVKAEQPQKLLPRDVTPKKIDLPRAETELVAPTPPEKSIDDLCAEGFAHEDAGGARRELRQRVGEQKFNQLRLEWHSRTSVASQSAQIGGGLTR